ncbi:MAG: hypothetical protein VYA34_07710 [Myxococcota bacterium]|nr:hypothetical protein [Myxococcota bacterium]
MRIKKLRWLADLTADPMLHHLANHLEATLPQATKNGPTPHYL